VADGVRELFEGLEARFQPDRAASIKVDYDESGNSIDAGKRAAAFQQILARVTALPGVEAAGIADYLPLGPNRQWDEPVPQGQQGKVFAPGELPAPLVYVVTPGFIRAMGIGLRGRDFTWADGPHSERVVLINASAARLYWPGEDAVGKVLMRGKEEDRVVGVVDDSGWSADWCLPAVPNRSARSQVCRGAVKGSTICRTNQTARTLLRRAGTDGLVSQDIKMNATDIGMAGPPHSHSLGTSCGCG